METFLVIAVVLYFILAFASVFAVGYFGAWLFDRITSDRDHWRFK